MQWGTRVGVGFSAAVGWVLGIAVQMQRPDVQPWSPGWNGALAALGLALILWAGGAHAASVASVAHVACAEGRHPRGSRGIGSVHRIRTLALIGGILAVFLALAQATTAARTAWRLDQRLPHALEGQVLRVEGRVAELPRRSARGVQFVFEVESAQTLQGLRVQGVPPRVWVGWWREGHVEDWLSADLPQPQPGQRWQLPLSLRRPHGTLNPHAFDAERWFLEQNLGASGTVPSAHRARAMRLDGDAPAWRSPQVWRSLLRERIDRHIADPRLAGLVAGLTIGDQSSVDSQDWALFRDTGVAHALSISGLHITAFAALAMPAVAGLWRLWPAGCLRWPAPLVGAWVGLGCAALYALLAGWGLPAQRTVAMLAVVTALRTFGVRWPAPGVALTAAVPVVVLDPWAVGQAGFWLSFAAVGLLLLTDSAQPARENDAVDIPKRGWAAQGSRLMGHGLTVAAGAVRTQAITSLGLAPLAAACFQQVSVVGVLANLLAIPWITLVLTPLCLLGLLWPPLWGLLPWVVTPLHAMLEPMAAWPWAVWTVAASPWPWLLLSVLGAALALMSLPLRMRACGLALMLPMLLPPTERPSPGRFEVWALDVGQGSAVLVRTREHDLLVDAGPAMGEGFFDAGERIVLPVLRGLGVRRLERLVITHRDVDHAGGAAAVLRALEVGPMLSSLEARHPLLRLATAFEPCRRGQQWRWSGVEFQMLHPFGDEPAKAKANTISCVLRVEDAHGRSVLIPGDIEADQERRLVDSIGPDRLRSSALVLAHHGSRTSSTEGFLDAVQPQWAVAQAGHRNRHGHPAPEVLERLAQRGVSVRDSPWCGAWRWDGQGPPQCWRQMRPRHWHDRPAPSGPAD